MEEDDLVTFFAIVPNLTSALAAISALSSSDPTDGNYTTPCLTLSRLRPRSWLAFYLPRFWLYWKTRIQTAIYLNSLDRHPQRFSLIRFRFPSIVLLLFYYMHFEFLARLVQAGATNLCGRRHHHLNLCLFQSSTNPVYMHDDLFSPASSPCRRNQS